MIGAHRPNHDYYVRMPAAAMDGLWLQHHATEVTCVPTCQGFTEWIAHHGDALLTVSWDWERLHDGAIVQPFPRLVLSNVMLLNEHALDLGVDPTEAALLRLVDRMDWKSSVARTCDQVLADSTRQHLLGWPRMDR